MRRIAASVLELVRRNHSYHYVDRPVWPGVPIVAEGDMANHAGMSVWADEKYAYVNLNASFLGVSFETQTAAGRGRSRRSARRRFIRRACSPTCCGTNTASRRATVSRMRRFR